MGSIHAMQKVRSLQSSDFTVFFYESNAVRQLGDWLHWANRKCQHVYTTIYFNFAVRQQFRKIEFVDITKTRWVILELIKW